MPGSCTGGGPTPCAPRGGGGRGRTSAKVRRGAEAKAEDTPGLKVPGLRLLLCYPGWHVPLTLPGLGCVVCRSTWPRRTMLPKLLQ